MLCVPNALGKPWWLRTTFILCGRHSLTHIAHWLDSTSVVAPDCGERLRRTLNSLTCSRYRFDWDFVPKVHQLSHGTLWPQRDGGVQQQCSALLYGFTACMLNRPPVEPHFQCLNQASRPSERSRLADWMGSSPDNVYITKCMTEMGVS